MRLARIARAMACVHTLMHAHAMGIIVPTFRGVPMSRTTDRLARILRKRIGAHVPMIGTGCTDDAYWTARAESDHAESLARYLAQHLARDAVGFAAAAGIPAARRA